MYGVGTLAKATYRVCRDGMLFRVMRSRIGRYVDMKPTSGLVSLTSIGEPHMDKTRIKQGALWAFTVVQQAITWAAVRLLGMAILSVVVKTWPVVAVATGGLC